MHCAEVEHIGAFLIRKIQKSMERVFAYIATGVAFELQATTAYTKIKSIAIIAHQPAAMGGNPHKKP